MATAEEYMRSMLELRVERGGKPDPALEEQSSPETRLAESNGGRWGEGDSSADVKAQAAIHKLEKDVLYWQDKVKRHDWHW